MQAQTFMQSRIRQHIPHFHLIVNSLILDISDDRIEKRRNDGTLHNFGIEVY